MAVYENETQYTFEAWLYVHPVTGVRVTQRQNEARNGERSCEVNITVPKSAFDMPDYRVDVIFEDLGPIPEVERIEADLRTHLETSPVKITLAAIPEPEPAP